MTYRHLTHESISDATKADVFRRADMYLHDVYGMIRSLPPSDGDGGGGNFSVALVLLCVIDGLARAQWPLEDQALRFKKLIRERMPWGPEGNGKWLDRGNAAKQLYVTFRNPLIHQLSEDSVGIPMMGEPVIGKWGDIPESAQNIQAIDGLRTWNDAWPILAERKDVSDNPRSKLTVVALYWGVKRLAENMIKDILNQAL